MAAKKFLSLVSGAKQLIAGVVTSAGASNDGDLVALDASGKLDASVLPAGVGADSKSLVASENLSAGDLVNVWDDTGTAKMRKADASNGRPAHGYVTAAVTATASGTMYKEGSITGLTGLTPGAVQYLSDTTPGAMTETAPSTATYIVQTVGNTMDSTEVDFEPGEPVTLG